MYYYTLPKIGTGTDEYPYEPDIPNEIPFVGNIGIDGEYIIATMIELPTKSGTIQLFTQQELENACTIKGIDYTDISKWNI